MSPMLRAAPLQEKWSAWLEPLRARWRASDARQQRALRLAAAVVALFLLWSLALQPAWRTVRGAPEQLDQLDAQLQQMQRLAAESRELRAAPALSTAQATAALKAATARLGDKGRLALSGQRATLTLNQASGDQLRNWLVEARSGARARPAEATLTRNAQGLSGSVVVDIGGTAP